MKYKIRGLKKEEVYKMNDFLYEAIFVPEGEPQPPKSIIELPELQVYVKDFGDEKSDIAFVAEIDNRFVGMVWVRIMNDYGHIDDCIPSLAISIYKEYRGQGIGEALMRTMIDFLGKLEYPAVSLAVQKRNKALNLYKKLGFEVVDENNEEYIMMKKLKGGM